MQILLRSEIQWFHARGKFRKNSVNEDIRLVENDVNPQKASGGGGGGGGGAKCIFQREAETQGFCDFNIIISRIFPENVIEILQVIPLVVLSPSILISER